MRYQLVIHFKTLLWLASTFFNLEKNIFVKPPLANLRLGFGYPLEMSSIAADISDLDNWIQLLMSCKQLPENDVKKLCEKVKIDA
jgi:hypothetical protein